MPGNPIDETAILSLPYIQPSQAQKHVTHNQALATLDVLVQLSVVAFDAETPPAVPIEGETHALGSAPTGVWAGQGDMLASWRDAIWVFIAPLVGWRAWGVTEAELRVWNGSTWGLVPAETNNLAGLGINTTADGINRLSVKSDATLLNHDGDDHQLKVNKAASGDTASLLFQSAFTGHAEMGLSGTNDFAIKVSDDGVTWTQALSFDGSNGTVTGPAADFSTLTVGDGAIDLKGNLTGGEEIIVADDAVASLTPPRKGGFAVITCAGNGNFSQINHSVMIYFDVGTSLTIEKNTGWVSPGSSVDVVTTDVTGTTGTDGNTTIAAQTDVVKIENRSGASRSYQVTWV